MWKLQLTNQKDNRVLKRIERNNRNLVETLRKLYRLKGGSYSRNVSPEKPYIPIPLFLVIDGR